MDNNYQLPREISEGIFYLGERGRVMPKGKVILKYYISQSLKIDKGIIYFAGPTLNKNDKTKIQGFAKQEGLNNQGINEILQNIDCELKTLEEFNKIRRFPKGIPGLGITYDFCKIHDSFINEPCRLKDLFDKIEILIKN